MRGRKVGFRQRDKLSSKVGPVVFKSAEICLQKWGELYSKSGTSRLLKWDELSSKLGELSSKSGASCLGASFMWGELSWGELSLGRVVLIPSKRLIEDIGQYRSNFRTTFLQHPSTQAIWPRRLMYIQVIQQFNDPIGVNCNFTHSGERTCAFGGDFII